MADTSQKTQPLPTTVRGTIANHYEPLNYASAVVLTSITAPWVNGPTMSAVWDLLSKNAPAVILVSDTKFDTPLNIERVAGEVFHLDLIQDSIGGWKPSWGATFDWDEQGEPVLAQGPGTRTILKFYCTGLHMLGSVFYKTPEA